MKFEIPLKYDELPIRVRMAFTRLSIVQFLQFSSPKLFGKLKELGPSTLFGRLYYYHELTAPAIMRDTEGTK